MTPSSPELSLWAVALIAAYFAGSIPVGLLIGRARGVDIRAHGSGNIGATNAMRVLGRQAGIACFVLDVAKGFLPAFLGGWALHAARDAPMSAAIGWLWMGLAAAAVLGHMFPVWLKFRGGKGVATGFGALLGVWPVMTAAALTALVVWLVSARVSRYVSVSSCLAAIALPAFVALAWLARARLAGLETNWPAAMPFFATATALAALVVWRHRGNLARVVAGVEPKIGQSGAADRTRA